MTGKNQRLFSSKVRTDLSSILTTKITVQLLCCNIQQKTAYCKLLNIITTTTAFNVYNKIEADTYR